SCRFSPATGGIFGFRRTNFSTKTNENVSNSHLTDQVDDTVGDWQLLLLFFCHHAVWAPLGRGGRSR
ncbi:hypothetical protein, partial [Halomonas alkaliantarctica]|uniref:hypothetical protein n=1 Tax=Halomonas alkaliantarctica TaxID=232346 RepID=UPI0005579576